MVRFTTRVELHDADENEYEQLHNAMAVQGFSRTIKDDKTGISYYLPPAEYDIEDPSDVLNNEIVLARATAAAQTIGRKYSILISPTFGRRWVGLEEVAGHKPSLADLLSRQTTPDSKARAIASVLAANRSAYNPYKDS